MIPKMVYNNRSLTTYSLLNSKVQARFAFATYLTRVQLRLVAETTSEETEDADIANEQMVWSTNSRSEFFKMEGGAQGCNIVEILDLVTLVQLSYTIFWC